MKACMTDSKRRLTMPQDLPPKSAVTIQRMDPDSWLVTRQKGSTGIVAVGLPCLEKLPDDPEWEAIERRMVKHNNQTLPTRRSDFMKFAMGPGGW